jgi:hypothetical protein
MAAAPLTPRSFLPGVEEITCSEPAGVSDLETFLCAGVLLALTAVSFSWPEAIEVVAANAQPATSATVAAAAVAAITRCRSNAAPAPVTVLKNDTARFSSMVGQMDCPGT